MFLALLAWEAGVGPPPGTAVDRIFLWSATGYWSSLSSSFDFSQNTSIVLEAWYLVQVHNPSSEALWVDVLEFTDFHILEG